MPDLRCPNKLHAKLIDGKLEVYCDSRWCGKRPGITVVHLFNPHTGELVDTRLYKTPIKPS